MQMRLSTFAALVAAASSSSLLVAAQSCGNALGDYCGNAQGSQCCPAAAYCQPWNNDFYQCLSVPTGCSEFETDVDYYGNDIGSVSKISPADCCAKCQATPACKYFTFMNLDPAGPTCYMKSSKTGNVRKVGAVSGHRTVTPEPTSPPTTPTPTTAKPTTPPSTCSTPIGEYCGNGNGVTACCPETSYCMPWDKYYYQCHLNPEGCGDYETDIDYYGNDIGSIANIQPWECCTKCRENVVCKFFSFVNSDPTTPPTCYLKSSNAGRVRKVGTVSGARLTPVPTPPLTPIPSGASQCVKHLKNIWYHGNDISEVMLADPELCCAECAKTKGCVLYSLMINSSTGLKRCVLKSAASNDKTNYGDSKTITAYSGFVINPLK